MATKRVTHTFRKGDILEVKEYHDGRYGARGLPREKKRKPTPEQMAVVNAMNKAETARHRLLEYFGNADMARITTTAMSHVTWHVTYFRDLRIYIRSLEDKEEVEKVTYGMDIPVEYQSEPLKAMIAAQSV